LHRAEAVPQFICKSKFGIERATCKIAVAR
jgi:hypothetical protein